MGGAHDVRTRKQYKVCCLYGSRNPRALLNEELAFRSEEKQRVHNLYVTIFGKIDHLRASNEIHFLPVQERYIHALSRNTNCLTIDGQVCFYRRLFTDAVKPRGCISRSWGALIGLHGVPNCSSRQAWPPLWIVSVHVTY